MRDASDHGVEEDTSPVHPEPDLPLPIEDMRTDMPGSREDMERPEVCDTPGDEDSNGWEDCADPVCAPHPACASIAPASAALAPALSVTERHDVWSRYKFLTDNPEFGPQRDVEQDELDPTKLAHIRGRVRALGEDGMPGDVIPGARVWVRNQPETGYAPTQSDGSFDMVVHARGSVRLSIRAPGYALYDTSVVIEPQADIQLVDVVLTPRATSPTSISLSRPMLQPASTAVIDDPRGTRQAHVLVRPNATARAVMADGQAVELDALDLTITEVTAGRVPSKSMSAPLPSNTAITWAAEFSVAQAEAMGAERVVFDSPQPMTLTNFLGFPTGTDVPLGYYNRTRGIWEGDEPARVIARVGANGFDADGDGQADATDLLEAEFGMDAPVRQWLVQTYAEGDTFWYGQLPHFSTWDANMNAVCGVEPNPVSQKLCEGMLMPAVKDALFNVPECAGGSIIECPNQTVGQVIGLAGTTRSLVYRSSDHLGHSASRRLSIPVLPGTTNPGHNGLLHADVHISVAGQTLYDDVVSNPIGGPLVLDLDWDGLDAYGRLVTSGVRADVHVVYWYPAKAGAPSRWNMPSGGEVDDVLFLPETMIMGVVSNYSIDLPAPRSPLVESFNGLSLSGYHALDSDSTLWMGDGRRILNHGSGDKLDWPGYGAFDVAGDAQGRLVLVEERCIKRVDVHTKTEEVLAGDCFSDGGFDSSIQGIKPGEHGTTSRFGSLEHVSVGGDGRIWAYQGPAIGKTTGPVLVSIAEDGSDLRIEAGTGELGSTTTATPGPQAALSVTDMHATSSGEVFLTEAEHDCVLRLGTDGILTPVWGACREDGRSAPNVGRQYNQRLEELDGLLGMPSAINEDEEGNIVIHRTAFGDIVRMSRRGRMELVAGGEQAQFKVSPGIDPSELAVAFGGAFGIGPSGRMVFASREALVDVSPDQYARVLGRPFAVRTADIGKDGSVWILTFDGVAYLKPVVDIPGEPNTRTVADPDGHLLYVFDAFGRHIQTRSARSFDVLETFEHGPDGRLERIVDANGRHTTFGRDRGGNLLWIEGPDAHRTTLSVNGLGLVERVTAPDGSSIGLQWADEPAGSSPLDAQQAGNLTTRSGLMTGYVTPAGDTKTYSYDTLGKLTQHTRADGQAIEFEREQVITPDFYGYKVTRTSAAGREQQWTFDVSQGHITTVDAAGITHGGITTASGTSIVQFASGEEIEVETEPHSRFGKQTNRPSSTRHRLPSGATHTTTIEYTERLELDGTTLESQEQRIIRDGIDGVERFTYDRATRTATHTKPSGLVQKVVYDDQMRIIRFEPAGLAHTELSWNAQTGRLDEVRQVDPAGIAAPRVTTYEYVEQTGLLETGSLARLQGPDGREIRWDTDYLAREQDMIVPDQAALMSMGQVNEIHSAWDVNGMPTTYKPFAGGSTTFEFDANDWSTAIHRPGAELGDPDQTTNFVWDEDGLLASLEHPDGSSESFTYKPGVRVLASHTDELEVRQPVYDPDTGLLTRIQVQATRGQTLGQTRATAYVWDGSRLESESWFEGDRDDLVLSVSYGYDDAFRRTSISYPGYLHAVEYDGDDRLIAADQLVLSYNASHGLVDSVTHNLTTHTYAHDVFGALERSQHSWNGVSLLDRQFTYDVNARIEREHIARTGRASVTRLYTYDERGHLIGVYEDENGDGTHEASELVESYAWDERGNLITRQDQLDANSSSGSVGEDDRVTKWADWTLGYNGRGHITRMANMTTGIAFSLDVDQTGRTRQVRFDDGRRIEYGLDASGRRVRRHAFDAQGNSVKDTRWVYAADSMRPTAEFDTQTGDVTRVFVWGAHAYCPQAIAEPGGRQLAVACDDRGSALMVWDAVTGQVIGEREYTAFGRMLQDTLTDKDVLPFGFAGGVFDEWTGLVRLGARDYSPELARFTAPDPLSVEAGPNLYQYSLGDPINVSDPTGLVAETPLDFAFIGLGMYIIYRDNIAGNCDNLWINIASLGADIAGALIPFATGLGLGARALAKARLAKTACFESGTPIATCDGSSVAIEDMETAACVRADPSRASEPSAPIAPVDSGEVLAWYMPDGSAMLYTRDRVIIGVEMTAPNASQQTHRLQDAIGARWVVGDVHATDVVPGLWRRLDVELEEPNGRVAYIQLLRPLWWLEQVHAREGGTIELELPEAGLRGAAYIARITDDVNVDSRQLQGSVVIGTMHHESTTTLSLVFDADDGQTLGVTSSHPFFSADRQAFVPADALCLGEAVEAQDGRVFTLTRRTIREHREPVFNIEVHQARSYYAGTQQLLVHNSCADEVVEAGARLTSAIGKKTRLARLAKQAGKDRGVQKGLDKLTRELARGNIHAGRGVKPIFRGISEMRHKNGARVYFRQARDGSIEIVGKSSKKNQDEVIEELRHIYGQ